MTPYHLHATTAAWSLHNARERLLIAAAIEDRELRLAASIPRDGLRSTTCGTRSPRGTHGDPAGSTALTTCTSTPRTGRHTRLHTSTTDTLEWLADSLGSPSRAPGADPLVRIQAAIPTVTPWTAATLTRWLTDLDRRIRDVLGLDPDQQPIDGNPACPVCGLQMLRLQTSAPDPAQWTVICTAGCTCTGPGCPCGMEDTVDGATHIWRHQP